MEVEVSLPWQQNQASLCGRPYRGRSPPRIPASSAFGREDSTQEASPLLRGKGVNAALFDDKLMR